jgi:selenocysteine lyase/cysteine desulfurase
MQQVAQHEADLTRYALRKLNQMEPVVIYGNRDPVLAETRLGVIPIRLRDISHFKAAAILGYEFGIGVRSGCFCAHPYILHLLGLTHEQAHQVQERMLAGDKSDMPGLIRASFGLYNSTDEVDAFIEALERIVHGDYKGVYSQDRSSGEYHPAGWSPDFDNYFKLHLL